MCLSWLTWAQKTFLGASSGRTSLDGGLKLCWLVTVHKLRRLALSPKWQQSNSRACEDFWVSSPGRSFPRPHLLRNWGRQGGSHPKAVQFILKTNLEGNPSKASPEQLLTSRSFNTQLPFHFPKATLCLPKFDLPTLSICNCWCAVVLSLNCHCNKTWFVLIMIYYRSYNCSHFTLNQKPNKLHNALIYNCRK